MNQIWHAVTETLFKDRIEQNRNNEQNNQTKLILKTNRLVQSKTYVIHRVQDRVLKGDLQYCYDTSPNIDNETNYIILNLN